MRHASRGHSVLPLLLGLLVTGFLPVSADEVKSPDAASIEFFETKVRPVLVARCVSCHGASQQFSSLRVDSREALLRGGNRGPAIVPGDAQLSLLAKAIRHLHATWGGFDQYAVQQLGRPSDLPERLRAALLVVDDTA